MLRGHLMPPIGVAVALAGVGCGGTSDSGFCSTHDCIDSFDSGTGSIVRCADGEYSHSGGEQGACSRHGGEERSDLFGGG